MLSLTEIEKAVEHLTADEKRELHRFLQETMQNGVGPEPAGRSHSILDISAVRLGSVLPASNSNADLLGEMLEGRQ
jgi:hypothetical protein